MKITSETPTSINFELLPAECCKIAEYYGYRKVVLCRECKNYEEWEGIEPSKNGYLICSRFGDEMPPTGYCSEGKAKEAGE